MQLVNYLDLSVIRNQSAKVWLACLLYMFHLKKMDLEREKERERVCQDLNCLFLKSLKQ